MVGAIVAYLVTAPTPVIGSTNTSRVSPFDLMLKAKDLPLESFEAN